MQVFTTGEVCRRLRIRMHRFCYLEQSGRIPRARRTGSGKRVFTEADINQLERALKKLEAQ